MEDYICEQLINNTFKSLLILNFIGCFILVLFTKFLEADVKIITLLYCFLLGFLGIIPIKRSIMNKKIF